MPHLARLIFRPPHLRPLASLYLPPYLVHSPTLPPSPSRAPLTGLRLLALLASGRTSEFHILLEALAAEPGQDGETQGALLRDEFVMWPVDLWVAPGCGTRDAGCGTQC